MSRIIYKVITFDATENKKELHPTIFWSGNAAVREANILFDDPDIDSVDVYQETEEETGAFKTSRHVCHFGRIK